MTAKTSDDIIKEAELQIEQEKKKSMEKKAAEAAAEIIQSRKDAGLDKVAVIEEPKIKTFEKNAAMDWAAIGKAAKGLGTGIMANSGTRNMLIGAGVGAAGGAVASKEGERVGGAIKGGLLGGVAGAGVSAFTKPNIGSLPSNHARITSVSPIKKFTNAVGLTEPKSFKRVGGYTKTVVPSNPDNTTIKPSFKGAFGDWMQKAKNMFASPGEKAFDPGFAAKNMGKA